VGVDAGVDSREPFPAASHAPGHDSHKHSVHGQWATGIAIAGVLSALKISGAEHLIGNRVFLGQILSSTGVLFRLFLAREFLMEEKVAEAKFGH